MNPFVHVAFNKEPGGSEPSRLHWAAIQAVRGAATAPAALVTAEADVIAVVAHVWVPQLSVI